MACFCHDPLKELELPNWDPDPTLGARVLFTGIVRGETDGDATTALEYDAYEPMALLAMTDLEAEAIQRFGVRRAWLVHRLGKVCVGKTTVLALVEAGHRHAAFAACEWLMDQVKKRVPIWKKEIGPNGEIWQHPSSGNLNPLCKKSL